jgi:hypothetical protein
MNTNITDPGNHCGGVARRSLLLLLPSLALLSAILFGAGCRHLPGQRAKGVGTLPPPPPPDQIKHSDYKPENPLVQLSPGVASRTLFTADEGAPYHVELQEILIAPQQRAGNLMLPGGTVVEVLEGEGAAYAGEKRQDLRAHSTFATAEGEPLNIENRGETHLTLRVLVIKAR